MRKRLSLKMKYQQIYNDSSLYLRQDDTISIKNLEKYERNFADFEIDFERCSNNNNIIKNSMLNQRRIILENFYKKLKEDEIFLADLAVKNFKLEEIVLNILKILIEYILSEFNHEIKTKFIDKLNTRYRETKDNLILSLKILKLFLMINQHYGYILSNNSAFIDKIMDLTILDKGFFKQTLNVMESMIAANPNTILPEKYGKLYDLMESLSGKRFARFSRVLALFVLENSDRFDFKEVPNDINDTKMIKIHSFLYYLENFLEKYNKTLQYLAEIMRCLSRCNKDNFSSTLKYIKDNKLMKDSGLNLNFFKNLLHTSYIPNYIRDEILKPKFIIKFGCRKSNITEILFIISNLLTGKRKINIQNKLSEIGFIDKTISPLFDLLFQSDIGTEILEDHDLQHEDNCQCNNPLATTRIQLLRVIINFCDRDSDNTANKDLFISKEEQYILYETLSKYFEKGDHNQIIYPKPTIESCSDFKKIFDLENIKTKLKFMKYDAESIYSYSTDDVLNHLANLLKNVKNKGLIHKAINILTILEPNSNYKFWLASCIESFLRGSNPIYQIFVAGTGLLFNLIPQIIKQQMTKQNNIQISYDLLGEIIKYNKFNIMGLENYLQKNNWNEELFLRIQNNMVDSNVFLRALILSFERFNYLNRNNIMPQQNINNDVYKGYIWEYISTSKLLWSKLLVDSVNPHTINQDNICCINTTLIILLFADQHNELELYLRNIYEDSGDLTKKASDIKKLLTLWTRYYLSKTKDSYGLQYSTSIPFHYFTHISSKIIEYGDQFLNQ